MNINNATSVPRSFPSISSESMQPLAQSTQSTTFPQIPVGSLLPNSQRFSVPSVERLSPYKTGEPDYTTIFSGALGLAHHNGQFLLEFADTFHRLDQTSKNFQIDLMREKLKNEKDPELRPALENLLGMVEDEYSKKIKNFFTEYDVKLKGNDAAEQLKEAYIQNPKNVTASLWQAAEASVPENKRNLLVTLKEMREALEVDGEKIDKKYERYGALWGHAIQAEIQNGQAQEELGSGLKRAQRFITAGDEIRKAIEEKKLSQSSGDALMKEHSDALTTNDKKLAPYAEVVASGWRRMTEMGGGNAKFDELVTPIISRLRDAEDPVSVLTEGNRLKLGEFMEYLDDSSEELATGAYQGMYKIACGLSVLLQPESSLTS